jgi:hypothetical protein
MMFSEILTLQHIRKSPYARYSDPQLPAVPAGIPSIMAYEAPVTVIGHTNDETAHVARGLLLNEHPASGIPAPHHIMISTVQLIKRLSATARCTASVAAASCSITSVSTISSALNSGKSVTLLLSKQLPHIDIGYQFTSDWV